jgi:diacylglycerol kinase family enzyme
LEEAEAQPWSVSIDGEQRDGHYLAVEILNIRFVGPNLPLALNADPRDGLLEVVLIGPEEREPLRDYVTGRLARASAELPQLPVMRGRDIRLEVPAGTRLHIDDAAWPDDGPLPNATPITVAVREGALRMMPGS